MNTILRLGIVFLVGLLSARLINKLKFPAVTAYLLLGILISPAISGFISEEILSVSGLISNLVLGMIAFSIGQNFSVSNFKQLGRSIVWISVLEALGAWFFVTLAFLFILKKPFYLSLLFGAIASATAPAATVMIIREYKARGSFTNTLLGVVAIDDAWCLIVFAISLALAKAMYIHMTNTFHIFLVLVSSLMSIGGAFILGVVLAVIFSYFSKFVRSEAELHIFTLGFIMLSIGLSLFFHLSVLLSCMFFGAVLVNIHLTSFKFFDLLRNYDSPLFLLFFVLAGANLEIKEMRHLGTMGSVYLIFRVLGKIIGAQWGAKISQSQQTVAKYIGWGLVPQAGVALGCALVVKSEFPSIGGLLFSTIVATTVVYEFIGPLCTRYALQKAGEILIIRR